MYRRYSQAGEGTVSMTQVKRGRLKNVLIFLLIAALAATLIITLPAMRAQNETRELMIQRIRSEVSEAIRQTSTLSRNAGADSAAILARIRSSVYTIRTLNSLISSMGGGMLVEEDRLTSLQNIIDRYLSFLTTGMDTGEYQTSLQTALNELQEIVSALN